MTLALRAMMPADEGAARALIAQQLAGTRYLARTLEQLHSAAQFDDPEFLAVLATPEGDEPVGLALFGTVAGALRCSKLHALLGTAEALDALAEGIARLADDAAERLLVCELPDDTLFADAYSALRRAGFNEEGSLPDLVRDGIALRLLVWRRG